MTIVTNLGFPRIGAKRELKRALEAYWRGESESGASQLRATAAELKAKGVELLQEPTDRPYGVEALIRDCSGNWIVLVEPREFSPEEMTRADVE